MVKEANSARNASTTVARGLRALGSYLVEQHMITLHMRVSLLFTAVCFAAASAVSPTHLTGVPLALRLGQLPLQLTELNTSTQRAAVSISQGLEVGSS